ncbi:MAG: adenylyltransferase/cytidyltransferase family protein [Actinomycetota bacterium]|nr:adenylyltransferase/cytidyltransferase family protein [Actinomycetota bacterium]
MNGSGAAPSWGCVHGRFQPFHNGHLEYVLRAGRRCQRLIVGITAPDPTAALAEAENPRRHEPASNPFTYFERMLMIRDTLLAEGLIPRGFAIVPFPIHQPELAGYYVPEGAVHFVRVYSGWEEEKVRRLRYGGAPVEVLDPRKEKTVSGAEVRRLISEGLSWEHLVPRGTAKIVHRVLAEDPPRLLKPV